MDPIVHSPYPFPDFQGVFLPWRLWTFPRYSLEGLEHWAQRPYIVGVA